MHILSKTGCKSHVAINSRKVKVTAKWHNFLLHETGPSLKQIAFLVTLQIHFASPKLQMI